ncbi:MAG: DUF3078 domain-containing protein [Chitinophagaceae bacterium]
MKKVFLFTLLWMTMLHVGAQSQTMQDLKTGASKTIAKDPNDTTKKVWKVGGLFNFTFGQTSLSNWAAGGDDLTINVNGVLNLHAFYLKDRNMWDNNLDLGLGYVKTTSLGSRKSNDIINLTSKYGYQLTPTSKWFVGILGDFRTQFAPGFNYPTSDYSYKISQFMSPGYGLISLGFDYKPNKDFSLFLSPITSRWVIVTAKGLDTLNPTQKGGAYGVPLGKTTLNQIGAYLSATYNKEIVKNVVYKGKLDLFSDYKNKPENINVYMTNFLSANIIKNFSFTVGLDVIYDDNVRMFGTTGKGARTQFREYIGIGYTKKF